MLGEYLQTRVQGSPNVPVILARGRVPLTYAGLFDQIAQTIDALNRAGYGRGDRIALALPPGPETTVAMLAALTGCVCVPLNPGASIPELIALLSRCRVDALITLTDLFGRVVQAATQCSIPIINLVPAADEAAGRFRLTIGPHRRQPQTGFSSEHELGAIFATSGTTAVPKLIPLTQADICCHGRRAMQYLGLTAADR